jgi:polyisoprenoid-binding protein YceI
MMRFMNKNLTRLLPAVALVAAGIGGVTLLPTPRAADAATATAAAKMYDVDTVHSTVVFSALYMGQSPFYGMFTESRGVLSYDGSDPASLRVNVELPMEAIDTHNEQRDSHLKAPDWFNAREYPTVTFTGSGATDNGDGTMSMQGELTLHGVTKPIDVTVTHLGAGMTPRGDRMGLGATFTVKRTNFGVDTMVGENGISDEIKLMVGLQAVAQ